MKFDIRQTNIAKGVAVLILLWSHLFIGTQDNASFISICTLSGLAIETEMVNYFSVCVSIFCLLSGYGIYMSYMSFSQKHKLEEKVNIKYNVLFVIKHLLKLLSGFWFIYIVFVPFGLITEKIQYQNILYFFTDFFGISYLFGAETVNVTWWYMGLIILLYILSPFLIKWIDKSPLTLLLLSFLVIKMDFLPYYNIRVNLFSFVLGVFVAKNNFFVFINNKLDKKSGKIIFGILSLIVMGYYKRLYSDISNAFFSMAIILVCFMLLSKLSIISVVLEQLGKHSGSIYMFHSFIYYYYFQSFIYMFKYSILIFIVMTVICYIVACILEFIKSKSYYDRVIDKIQCKITNKMIKSIKRGMYI